ncbi:hypothetical protein FA15DRAFT_758208 [Coprinopsis marcescibilis]|uniref:HAM1-like N-terminal domain-containing protein n=1 Tax=Coprinopsis marcescibilis TaxID=230819 RepID=A0A5C3KNX1_COPMA|nr:hypothetical protein FA15DRAFT_758208 [Coprinopsis marcescibilis]
MDACLSCFGKKSQDQLPDNEEDREPLLPNQLNSHHFQTYEETDARKIKIERRKNGRSINLDGAGFLNGEQEARANLGEGSSQRGANRQSSNSLPFPEKLVDIVAAFRAGKLPTQDQISRLLQLALNSELLKDSAVHTGIDPKVVHGFGPTSKQGRKVLGDVRNVIQAVLTFGMEKNDDNKLQDLFYNLRRAEETREGTFDFKASDYGLRQGVYDASESVLEAGKKSAAEVKDQVPEVSEISGDIAILAHALQTLIQSALTSSVFRFLVVDIVSILRDLAAHGASDVKDAALRVHTAAEGVEQNLKDANVDRKVDAAMNEVQKTSSDRSIQEQGLQAISRTVEVAEGAKEKASKRAGEWAEHKDVALDKARDSIISRLQQILVRVQEDQASRSALRSILILARKYADKLAETGDIVAEAAEEIAQEVTSTAHDIASSTQTNSDEGNQRAQAWNPPHSYPPPTSLYPPVSKTAESDSSDASVFLKQAFVDLKTIFERAGQGHSLDGLVKALVNVCRDLKELPVEVQQTVAQEVDHKAGDAKGKGKAKDEGGSPHFSEEKHEQKGKGKRRKRKEKKGGGSEFISPQLDSRTSSEQPSGSPSIQAEDRQKSGVKPPNVLANYFARLGDCLDNALDEPGWVTSRNGSRELEALFDDGVEILNVVGEAVVDVGSIVAEGDSEAGDLDETHTDNAGQKETSKESEDHALKIRRRFKAHASSLVEELEAYVSAVERDRSTMKLLRALDALSTSTSSLFSSVSSHSARGHSKSNPHRTKSFAGRIRSSLQWTDWVAWALPRLAKMIPLDSMPIPSLEARSHSGGWEAGLYALFVKGEAAEFGIGKGRKGRGRNDLDPVVGGGIQTTLVPDEIVIREWTEVRIDMVDEPDSVERPLLGHQKHVSKHWPGRDHLVAEREVEEPHLTFDGPQISSTSRIRFHVDGIRAKVDGLGYYFKYGQPDAWLGYEDEGIMNVDIGMNHPHAGLGCDIEIELTSNSNSAPPEQNLRQNRVRLGDETSSGTHGGDIIPVPGEDISSDEGEDEEDDGPANIDIQRAIGKGPVGREREQLASQATGLPHSAFRYQAPLEPLFKVVHVHIQMDGVEVILEKSRHWILNKLLVQPLAGPTVRALVGNVLERRVTEKLEDLSIGLARLVRDAEIHGEIRREGARRKRVEEKRARIAKMKQQGRYEDANEQELLDIDYEEEEGWAELVEDWCHAIAESGSRVLEGQRQEEGPDKIFSGKGDAMGEATIRMRTQMEATSLGLILHSTTARVEDDIEYSSPKVFNKHTRQMEPVADGVGGVAKVVERETDETDVSIAVGGGAQLFNNKQVPYGQHNDAAGREGEGLLNKARSKVAHAVGETVAIKDEVKNRYNRDLERERGPGWRSEAFDF